MKKTWTEEDVEFLKREYLNRHINWMVEKLERSIPSIRSKAQEIGLIYYSPNKWTEEEIQFMKTNYSTIGRKRMAEELGRASSSVGKKAKELGLKVRHRSATFIPKEELQKAVNESFSWSETLRVLGRSISGPSVRQIKKYGKEYKIDTSHFDPYKASRQNCGPKGRPIEYYLQEGTNISSSKLKEKLYKAGLKKRQCEMSDCDQGEEWKGKKISLILDHINGVNNDNRLENLRIVCPNCNAALPTHCKGHKGL